MTSKMPGAGALEEFRSFTMAHPRLIEARDELLEAIEGAAPGTLILVLGPTGVGKTTLIRKVQQCLTEKLMPDLESDVGRLPFVGVEAIAPDSGSFNWRDHFRRMLLQIQEPLIDHKTRAAYLPIERDASGHFVASPRVGTGAQLQYAAEQALRYRRPAAVFIDEAQHLARMSSGRRLADQLDVLKSIASRTQTIHILIGTYELLPFRNLSGQLSRRSMDIHFSRYRAESNGDMRIFQNVALTFQRQLPPDQSVDLLGMWEFLYERSLGCVGILKDWITRSLHAAYRTGRSLNRGVLERTALSIAQCEKILAEAREGETRLMENRESASRLRCLLGFSEPSTIQDAGSAPPQPPRTKKPGLRRPRRDRIGCAMAAHV
jgi:energy-coupling factor transporter ATP-binding protein EcfA2